MAENYDLIFGQNASQAYSWSDSDYLQGWGVIGNLPPTAVQFDALFARLDRKAKDLNLRMLPLEASSSNMERQKSKSYNVGDIAFYYALHGGFYLECTTAGTTSSEEITLPDPIEVKATVADGSVVWTIRKLGSGGGFVVSTDAPSDTDVMWIKPID